MPASATKLSPPLHSSTGTGQSALTNHVEEFKKIREAAQNALLAQSNEFDNDKGNRTRPASTRLRGMQNLVAGQNSELKLECLSTEHASSLPASSKKKFIKVKDAYELEDFKIVVKLGEGAFGAVFLVELDPRLNGAPNQTEPLQFAMKVMDKSKIHAEGL